MITLTLRLEDKPEKICVDCKYWYEIYQYDGSCDKTGEYADAYGVGCDEWVGE